jgi:hypothetical protein
VRVRVAAAAALTGALALMGCGGVRAADLFLVTRSGATPASQLTLVVDEEGGVRCDGRPPRKLSDRQLVQARAIQEDLHDAAAAGLRLAARPGSVYAYTLREESGTVSFADNSARQLKAMHELQLFVAEVAAQVCHVSQ